MNSTNEPLKASTEKAAPVVKPSLEGRDIHGSETKCHPIHSLIVEILILIFEKVINDHVPSETLSQKSFPPVLLSQVCQKWRAAALSTSHLWSHVTYKGRHSDEKALQIFLERSKSSPLHLCYKLNYQSDFSTQITPHANRWQTLSVFTQSTAVFDDLMNQVNKLRCPNLHSLELHYDKLLCYPNNPKFLKNACVSTGLPSLTYVRLSRVPMMNIPALIFFNVRYLELSFPRDSNYVECNLRITTLYGILSCSPQLEHLVLFDTVPVVDAILIDGSDSDGLNGVERLTPVALPRLRKLEWSFPGDVQEIHRSLLFLDAPSLEKLELFTGDATRLKIPETLSSSNIIRHPADFVCLSSVKELNFLFWDKDTVNYALRMLLFPELEKLELSYIDPRSKSQKRAKKAPKFQPFALPRLDCIMRDPRLPHLSYLMLSNVEMVPDYAKLMLAYMPALVSLCMDNCFNVPSVMSALSETTVVSVRGEQGEGEREGTRHRRLVKVCPRLDAVTLWGCHDAEFEGLVAIVAARDLRTVEAETDIRATADSDGSTRAIKPLRRRTKRTGQAEEGGSALCAGGMEVSSPIKFITVKDCKKIGEADLLSLKDRGVLDVSWNWTL